MKLNRVSNNKHCKYHCVVLNSFGQTNQLASVLLYLNFRRVASMDKKCKDQNLHLQLKIVADATHGGLKNKIVFKYFVVINKKSFN